MLTIQGCRGGKLRTPAGQLSLLYLYCKSFFFLSSRLSFCFSFCDGRSGSPAPSAFRLLWEGGWLSSFSFAFRGWQLSAPARLVVSFLLPFIFSCAFSFCLRRLQLRFLALLGASWTSLSLSFTISLSSESSLLLHVASLLISFQNNLWVVGQTPARLAIVS